jgi:hypothetical protein
MICGMAFLNGREVRERAAELAPRGLSHRSPSDSLRDAAPHITWLADRTGIPVGTLHNATRETSPQPVSQMRVFDLAAQLARAGEDVRDVAAAITAGDEQPEPTPDPPSIPPSTPERERDPSGPKPRKNGKSDRRGPPRSASFQAAS